MSELKSFSEVMPGLAEQTAKEKYGDTKEFYPFPALFDKSIIVKDAEFLEGDLGETSFIFFNFEDDEKEWLSSTMSNVIGSKLHFAKKDALFPLKGTITRHGKYYDIN